LFGIPAKQLHWLFLLSFDELEPVYRLGAGWQVSKGCRGPVAYWPLL